MRHVNTGYTDSSNTTPFLPIANRVVKVMLSVVSVCLSVILSVHKGGPCTGPGLLYIGTWSCFPKTCSNFFTKKFILGKHSIKMLPGYQPQGKVIFFRGVCLFTGCLPPRGGVCPPSGRHYSEGYASYWNAFLFYHISLLV